MKNKWSNYALKTGKVQSSYIREYCSRSPKRKAREAGSSHSIQQSREEQEEVKFVYREAIPKPDINPKILEDAYVINLREINEDICDKRPIGDGTSKGTLVASPNIPKVQSKRRRKTASIKEPHTGS